MYENLLEPGTAAWLDTVGWEDRFSTKSFAASFVILKLYLCICVFVFMYLTVGKTGFLPKVFSQIDNVVWEGRCSRKSVAASCDMFASDQCQVVGD